MISSEMNAFAHVLQPRFNIY